MWRMRLSKWLTEWGNSLVQAGSSLYLHCRTAFILYFICSSPVTTQCSMHAWCCFFHCKNLVVAVREVWIISSACLKLSALEQAVSSRPVSPDSLSASTCIIHTICRHIEVAPCPKTFHANARRVDYSKKGLQKPCTSRKKKKKARTELIKSRFLISPRSVRREGLALHGNRIGYLLSPN